MIRDDDLRNENVEGYRIVARPGSPIFSSTFLGESLSPTAAYQRVIIKLLSTVRAHTPQQQQDILDKIAPLQQLKHPHILPILAVGFHKDAPYIMTKYLPAGSLYARFQRRPPGQPTPMDDAIRMLAQVGQAIHYAHQQQVIHGSLKPQNVLFTLLDDVLVTGFHQHALLLSDETEDTQSLDLSIYLAPEQLAGQTSEKSDQYALGCIAYALFTGSKAFMVPSVKTPGTYYKTRSLIPPRRLNSALPAYIEEAILKAMAREPDQRYRDIAAFLAALRISPMAGNKDLRKTETHLVQATQGEVPALSPTGKASAISPIELDRLEAVKEQEPIDKDENRTNTAVLDDPSEAVTLPNTSLRDESDEDQDEDIQIPFPLQQTYHINSNPSFNKSAKKTFTSRSKRGLLLCLLAITLFLATLVIAMHIPRPAKTSRTSPAIHSTVIAHISPQPGVPTPLATKQDVSSPSDTTFPSQGSTGGQGTIPSMTPPPTASTSILGFSQGVNGLSSSQAQFWFAPNGWTAAYVIVHYTDIGQLQQNIQMSSNGTGLWQYTANGFQSAQTITYWFTYQQNGTQYDSGTYTASIEGSGAPAPTPIPTPVPTTSRCASNFSQGVNNIGSGQGQFWFSPCGWTSIYVIVHYTGTGQAQQNIQMFYNGNTGSWQYTISALHSHETLTYWFTYQQNGIQYDSSMYSWTY
ncbi:MAG TPA: serine/threonine-protein kinase [Ktedonobacteraceae bacterium]